MMTTLSKSLLIEPFPMESANDHTDILSNTASCYQFLQSPQTTYGDEVYYV